MTQQGQMPARQRARQIVDACLDMVLPFDPPERDG
jgi:hypothetical protein